MAYSYSTNIKYAVRFRSTSAWVVFSEPLIVLWSETDKQNK